jgi:hypothetical protein
MAQKAFQQITQVVSTQHFPRNIALADFFQSLPEFQRPTRPSFLIPHAVIKQRYNAMVLAALQNLVEIGITIQRRPGGCLTPQCLANEILDGSIQIVQ